MIRVRYMCFAILHVSSLEIKYKSSDIELDSQTYSICSTLKIIKIEYPCSFSDTFEKENSEKQDTLQSCYSSCMDCIPVLPQPRSGWYLTEAQFS